MSPSILIQHLLRAWRRHGGLQVASVTVMAVVLLLMNLLFLGFTAFNQMVAQWGQGLEMIVYVTDDSNDGGVAELRQRLKASGDFDRVEWVSKSEATKKFLTSLGPESLELLRDPKWKSPIPASLELRLSERISAANRVGALQNWASQLHQLPDVEDVFYGQGWVENFASFMRSARGLMTFAWILSLVVGLLIVGNCIRLSIQARSEEIKVLELVGASSRFIRWPFLAEGICIGFLASIISLALSAVLHSLLLDWLGQRLNFWMALQQVPSLPVGLVLLNLTTGIGFGWVGAWHCVRQLNTGWSAAVDQ